MSDLEASLQRSTSSAWQLEVRVSYGSLLRAASAMTWPASSGLPPRPGQLSRKHSSAESLPRVNSFALTQVFFLFFLFFFPQCSDTTSGSISRRQQHLMSCSSLLMEGYNTALQDAHAHTHTHRRVVRGDEKPFSVLRHSPDCSAYIYEQFLGHYPKKNSLDGFGVLGSMLQQKT